MTVIFMLFECTLTYLYLVVQTYSQRQFGIPALELNTCKLLQSTWVLYFSPLLWDIGDSEGVLRKNASTTLKICQLVTSVMLAQLPYKVMRPLHSNSKYNKVGQMIWKKFPKKLNKAAMPEQSLLLLKLEKYFRILVFYEDLRTNGSCLIQNRLGIWQM